MIELIQEAIENNKIKGATWEKIEERRISNDYIDELVNSADKDTHLIISSCPEIYFEKLIKSCGVNRIIHLTFARNNDINELFSIKRKEEKKKKEKTKEKTKQTKKNSLKFQFLLFKCDLLTLSFFAFIFIVNRKFIQPLFRRICSIREKLCL